MRSLAVLKNGNIASGSQDGYIRIWNIRNGNLNHTIPAHSGWVYSLIVLHNGNLVSGSWDYKIKIWNEARLVETLSDHTCNITCLTLLPGSTDFASGSFDKTIRVWSCDGKLKSTFPDAHDYWVVSLVGLKNNRFPDAHLASGDVSKQIKIWNRSGIELEVLNGHTDWVWSIVELNNGMLASGSLDKTVRIWNENAESEHMFKYESSICALAVLPNGDLVCEGNNNCIKIMSQEQVMSGNSKGKQIIESGHKEKIYSFVVFPNGNIASGSTDKTVKIWEK